MEVTFITLSEVLEIHRDQLQRYGGSPGIRSIQLLQPAVGMPGATYAGNYLHSDIYEMTAAYLYHLVQNHPFIDGNKRTGAVSALVFLALNGFTFNAPEDDFADMVLTVARGELGKSDVARFIRQWSYRP
mgnify:CR=1 FL=1